MEAMASTRVVALYGEDHPELDDVATADLGGSAAITLSRGRYHKVDDHPDPNEDGVVAAVGAAGWLLAVADGHHGFDVARAALRTVADSAEPLLAHNPKPDDLRQLCDAVMDAAADASEHAVGPRQGSDAALTVVVVAGSRLLVANYGDTAVARLRGARAKVLTEPQPFLCLATEPPQPRRVRLRAGDRVVAASDGVTDFLGRDWPTRMAALTEPAAHPLQAVRALPAAAMDGGAGDHLAAALLVHRDGSRR